MRRTASQVWLTDVTNQPFVTALVCTIVVLSQRSAEASICKGARTLFTLSANVSHRAFDAEVFSIRKSGYEILLQMPELQMIVGCYSDFNGSSSSHESTPLPRMTHEGIIGIESDGVLRAAGQKASWALDRIDQPSLPLDKYHFDPSNCSERLGSDVDIYVIDTGCQTTHSAFISRLIRAEAAPGSEYASGEDDHGHGTAVASLVIGRDTGAAARANVTCIKALNRAGTGRFSDVIAALSVAVSRRKLGREQRGTFAVLSLTAAAHSSYTAMDKAVSRAARQGVVTFAAAGNDGRDACKFTPGRNGDSVAVGATDEKDKIADFSNFGRCVDAVAPGRNVLTASMQSEDSFKKETGTSFSTPLVAGVVALKWGEMVRRGGMAETEGARRVMAGMRNVSAAGFQYRMPTLNGRCHSGRSYNRITWGLMTMVCIAGAGLMIAGVGAAKWWVWWRPWMNRG